MKTRSKALLLSLCAVLLVAASVFGTMAYLTSNDSVVNTFTVGSVSITLDEADVKTDGTYETNHDTVKEEVTKEQMNALDSESSYPTLTFTAYAVQLYKSNTEQFEPAEAWEIAQGLSDTTTNS